MNLETIEMKAFVPARDLAESIAFYEALGFEIRRPMHVTFVKRSAEEV